MQELILQNSEREKRINEKLYRKIKKTLTPTEVTLTMEWADAKESGPASVRNVSKEQTSAVFFLKETFLLCFLENL